MAAGWPLGARAATLFAQDVGEDGDALTAGQIDEHLDVAHDLAGGDAHDELGRSHLCPAVVRDERAGEHLGELLRLVLALHGFSLSPPPPPPGVIGGGSFRMSAILQSSRR